MAVGAPRVRVVNDQLVAHRERARELGDRQVEAHPLREAVGRRDPQERRAEAPVGAVEDEALEIDLQLGVKGDGRELRFLGGRLVGVAEAVVRAGRREDQPVDAGIVGSFGEALATVVDLPGKVRVLARDRVSDERGENHHVRRTFERRAHRIVVVQVAQLKAEGGILDQARQNGAVVEKEAVENSDLVAGRQQLSREDAADVAGATHHENVAISVLVAHRRHHIEWHSAAARPGMHIWQGGRSRAAWSRP